MPRPIRGCAPPDVIVGWLISALATAGLAVLLLRRRPRQAGAPHSPWRDALDGLRAERSVQLATVVVLALVIMALLAPLLAPYDPTRPLGLTTLNSRPPSFAHPFGTDPLSRDVLSRVLYGARVSLAVSSLAVLVAVTVGTVWGAVAGFLGGIADTALMRLVDACLAIPRLLLLVAVVALWDRLPLPALVLLIGLTGWFGISRLVRAQVLALREQDFVLSARALGASDPRILVRHILPNVVSPVIVAATLGIGNVIVLEAGLSYLGIGVRPPVPSWGSIIQDGADQIVALPWLALFPGMLIVITALAFNTLGDALRDALDPRFHRAS